MTSNGKSRQEDRVSRASLEAAGRFLRARNGLGPSPGDADQSEFSEQTAEQTSRVELMASIWDRLDALSDDPVVRRTQSEFERPRPVAVGTFGWLRSPGLRLPGTAQIAAASVVGLLLIFVGLLSFGAFDTALGGVDEYQTAVGEQKRVVLADGSSVILNTQTELEVNYSEDLRQIDLKKGQALVSVVRDPARPLVVEVENTFIRVLGTQFDIRKLPGKVRVTVLEGKIQLGYRSALGEDAIDWSEELVAGQQIVVGGVEADRMVRSADVDRVASWRFGRLDFDAMPLNMAIDEINRYSDTQILVEDPEVGRMVVSGVFKIGESEKFARALEKSFPVKVAFQADGNISIQTMGD